MKTGYEGATILGVAEADLGVFPELTSLDLHLQAILRAIEAAGVSPKDIDGVCVSKGGDLRPRDLPALDIAQALGIEPRFIDTTLAGGASPVIQVARAAQAISEGRCTFAVVSYASTQASRHLRSQVPDGGWPGAELERSTGYRNVISVHALVAQRHMFEFNTTERHFASVAVAARSWAALNPSALRREPLTVEDVLASPIVSSPLHALDCCLVTDGGGAVVLGPRRFRGHERPVVIRGFAERHSPPSIIYRESLTKCAAVDTGLRALAESGLRCGDIDVLEIYDAFTDMPIVLLECLGFMKPGQAGPAIAEGQTMPGGNQPMNTAGGGLSHCHPGMYGVFLVIEAVRQLQGNLRDRQVPNADLALCHGVGGGGFGSHATLVLEGLSVGK